MKAPTSQDNLWVAAGKYKIQILYETCIYSIIFLQVMAKLTESE